MKEVISHHDADAGLAEIRSAIRDLADFKQIIPLQVKAMTTEDGGAIFRSLARVKSLYDRAVTLRSRIKTSALARDITILAGELQLVIERAAGELLTALELRGGDRKSPQRGKCWRLDNLGISPTQSHRWQLEAQLPDADFAAYLGQASSRGQKSSSRGLRRLAKTHVERVKLAGDSPDLVARAFRGLRRLADEGKRFGSIYVDLGWAPARTRRANGSLIDQRLAQLPVMEISGPQVCLYLKIAPAMLDDARKALIAWGFTFAGLLFAMKESFGPRGSLQAVRRCCSGAFAINPDMALVDQRIGLRKPAN